MSYQYQPKNSQTMEQGLKVQELSVRGNDLGMTAFFGAGTPPVGSPNLATAAPFAILANSAITNTGSSLITGNLGEYPGTSVTGFPPGIVAGIQHITDSVAQQAEIDAQAAYTYLAGLSSTAISAVLDGQTLTPGVYRETSGTFALATSGNGTLTLNGAGLYVFKCASTLTTGAGGIPTIALTNGARAADVYWICGSSATINVGVTTIGATFRGTIIATASVTVSQASNVDGRLIALGAAITLSGATNVTLPAGTVNNLVLLIREPILQVDNAKCKVDTLNTVTEFPLASLSIVDSVLFTPGGDLGAILISGLTSLAANDMLSVRYRAKPR